MDGQKQIADMMEAYRTKPPAAIAGSDVVHLLDYDKQVGTDLKTGKSWAIKLPKSNVLQFILADGSKISARPSGTEPKIKFYFSVFDQLKNEQEFETVDKSLNTRIERIIADMNLK